MNKKPRFDIPEPRKKQPKDYKIPDVPESPPMPGKYEEPKLPWYKFYRHNGFKRILGGVTLITGGVLSLFPATSAIGQVILILGGVIEGLGIGDAVKKKSKKKDDSWGQIIFDIIIRILTHFTKKEK